MHWHYFGPARTPFVTTCLAAALRRAQYAATSWCHDHRVRRGQSKALYERVLGLGGLAIRRVYENLGHAELILECVRWRRPHSFVIEDIARYLNALTTHSVAEMERTMALTPSTTDELLVEQHDRVALITLNQPDRFNASRDMLDELSKKVVEANKDPDIRCIVLTGAGKGFCSGLDLIGVRKAALAVVIQRVRTASASAV